MAKMRFLDVMGLSSQRCRCQIGNAQIKDFCKSSELQDLTRMIHFQQGFQTYGLPNVPGQRLVNLSSVQVSTGKLFHRKASNVML